MTPLHTAAASGDLPSLTTLLGTRRGLRLSRDELGRNALHLAASAGHLGAVRALLQAAAPKEKDATDAAGCTALHRAAADGHDAVVKVLIECGVLLDKQDQVHGNTALHEASWKGYSRTVAILASAGANLQLTNSGGFTALHLCCQNGHNQSCRELLLAGCDPDLQNNYGDTSLHTSARYGHAGVTRILISAQCHVSDQNKNGDTALHIAAAMGRRKLTRILLEAGCDRTLRNKQQETAKDIATRKGLAEICSLLESVKVKRGKKKKEKDKNDKSKKPKHKPWSPYGCHYYPDSTSFPKPRLDSLPADPLRKGEQYYLDLAGNIRKGPVGVGYTCYCAPLFQHMQQRLERDKQELKETIEKANERLGYKMAGLEHRTRGHLQQLTRSAAMDRVRCERRHRHLEQWLSRGVVGRHSERAPPTQPPDLAPGEGNSMNTLSRSKSLDQLLEEGRQVGLAKTVGSLDELEVEKDKHEEPRRTVAEIVASLQSPPSNHHPFIPRYTPDIQWSHQEQPTTSTCLPDDCVSESSEDEGVGVLPRSRSPVYSPGNTPGLTGIAGLTGLTGIAEQLTRVKLEDDSGYSTKVYGSSKGNSPMGDEKRVAGSLV